MRATYWFFAAAAALALAACVRETGPDSAGQRSMCLDADAAAGARAAACTALIESGELSGEDRAAIFANRGAARAEAGEVTPALRDFNTALEGDENAALALRGKARILIESGQLDAADPLVQRLIESGEFPADAHYLAGAIAQQRSDFTAASEAYGRAIEADGRYAMAYANRAAIKQTHEDHAGALADYDMALAIDARLAPALAGRCWTRVLMRDGDLEAARVDADAAAGADPRNVQAQLCRGLLQLRAGEWANARASYEAALAVEPGNPAALFGRGVARRRSGDREGRADMNQARDFEPHVARRFEDLGVETY